MAPTFLERAISAQVPMPIMIWKAKSRPMLVESMKVNIVEESNAFKKLPPSKFATSIIAPPALETVQAIVASRVKFFMRIASWLNFPRSSPSKNPMVKIRPAAITIATR